MPAKRSGKCKTKCAKWRKMQICVESCQGRVTRVILSRRKNHAAAFREEIVFDE